MDAAQLQEWCARLLSEWRYPDDDAHYVATTLVDANLRGIDSHGVIRLPAYWRRIEAGLVSPTARPNIDIDGATVQIDAAGMAGQLAARAAVETLRTTARHHGVASATVRNSSHLGAAGFYTRSLAQEGFVAFAVSNSEPIVVPHGGKQAVLGTNPFAFAAPATPYPLSIDMATSTVAMGKVLMASAERRPIPADWGIDADGNPTTNPDEVIAALPFAGPKGYGMSLLVESMAGVLSGSAISSDVGNMYTDFSKPQRSGHWLMALDVERHMPLADFLVRMATLLDRCHASPPAPGFERVLTPGEPEELIRDARLTQGIPIPMSVIQELDDLGHTVDLPFPEAKQQPNH